MAVVGEPYRQWVLEDAFVAARPRWELDGALFVPDVAPYQLMKLRLLNGSHSAMAYLGAAAGCATVADVLATEWGEPLVRAFGAEVAPTLPRRPAGSTPSATSTTWSPGSATPPCSTCCARSARTDR